MTYKRYSIFPLERGRGHPIETTNAPEPVTVFMDESGNGNLAQPLIVGAVVVDLDACDIEEEIRLLHKELSARRTFRGHKGFEKFQKNGFHASTDSPETKPRFIELIQRGSGFKILMIGTWYHTRGNMTEKQVLSEMYQSLVADILLQHHSQSVLTICIEDNVGLRRMLREIPRYAVLRAQIKLGRLTKLPEIRMELAEKGSVMTLAVADYAMLIASQWMHKGCVADLAVREYRAFREIEPSISLFYLLEDGVKLNRKTHSDLQ